MRKSNIDGGPDDFPFRTHTAKSSSEHTQLGGFVRKSERIPLWFLEKVGRFKEQRHLIELASASRSLDEVAKAMGRKPETIKKMAMRLGVSFKPKDKTK